MIVKNIRLPEIRRAEYWIVIALIAFAAVLTVPALIVGIDQVLAPIRNVGAGVILVLLGLSLVNYGLRAFRWQIFSRRLGLSTPLFRTALYYVAGFALTMTPAKLGDAFRLWLLNRCHGFRYDRTVPILVADRIGDVLAMVLLSLVGLYAFRDYALGAGIAAGVVLLALVALARPDLLLRAIGLAYRVIGRWPRLFGGLRRLACGRGGLRHPPGCDGRRHRLAAGRVHLRLLDAGGRLHDAARRSRGDGGDHDRPPERLGRSDRSGDRGDAGDPRDHAVVRRRPRLRRPPALAEACAGGCRRP
jgi:hypothetical protein